LTRRVRSTTAGPPEEYTRRRAKVPGFFGTPLVLGLPAGQPSGDAGPPPVRQPHQRIGPARANASAPGAPRDPRLTGNLPGMDRARACGCRLAGDEEHEARRGRSGRKGWRGTARPRGAGGRVAATGRGADR